MEQEEHVSPVAAIGAVIIVAVIVAGVLLWPKQPKKETATPVVEEKSMITKLSCDKQWYNPKLGYAEYYLSAEGGALATATTVDCAFTITAVSDKKVLTTEKIPAIVANASERGGKTFRCTTIALPLPKGTQVMMVTTVTDDVGGTASCAAGTILLP